MDEKTLTALRGSIAKWRAIVDGTGTDDGPRNCPLCKMFLLGRDGMIFSRDSDRCKGCPIPEKTGHISCDDTPYWPYVEAEENGAEDSELRKLAQAELDFLISLLPEGESACVEVDGAARA